MMADIDAFLAEIRSDAAGAAEAWQLVKQLLADRRNGCSECAV